MTARYDVLVSDDLLAERPWLAVKGLRLVEVTKAWSPVKRASVCTFEDDEAGPEFEGRLVDFTLRRTETPDGPLIEVIGRQIVA